MIRKALLLAAIVALAPTFALAAPAAMTPRPAAAHTQTVRTVKARHVVVRHVKAKHALRHHHAVKKVKIIKKTRPAPARKV